MAERVVRGYDTVPERCPYCGGSHMAFVDDGDDATYQVKCWCGAKARVRKDDPDLVALLADSAVRRTTEQ